MSKAKEKAEALAALRWNGTRNQAWISTDGSCQLSGKATFSEQDVDSINIAASEAADFGRWLIEMFGDSGVE